MGESTNACATLRFDRRIRLEFRGATITSDAGLLACRELDDALGLTETASECLQESRGGRNVQHRLVGLLRQSVYSRLAGYEDTNDAERLILSQKVCAGRIRTKVPTPGYNIQSLFRILPQHTVALRCAKSLELPQNGFLRGNQRLSDDPTMRVIVGRRGGPERPAASTNTMSRFETEVLTQDGNVEGLIPS